MSAFSPVYGQVFDRLGRKVSDLEVGAHGRRLGQVVPDLNRQVTAGHRPDHLGEWAGHVRSLVPARTNWKGRKTLYGALRILSPKIACVCHGKWKLTGHFGSRGHPQFTFREIR